MNTDTVTGRPERRFPDHRPPHRTTDAEYAEWVRNVVSTFPGEPEPHLRVDIENRRLWREEARIWTEWLADQTPPPPPIVVWRDHGDVSVVECAGRDCPEPCAVVAIDPDRTFPVEIRGRRRAAELRMRVDPLARYCPLHANFRDLTRPWHSVRVHFPADGFCGARYIDEAIRGLDPESALYFAGMNWPAAVRIDYIGLYQEEEPPPAASVDLAELVARTLVEAVPRGLRPDGSPITRTIRVRLDRPPWTFPNGDVVLSDGAGVVSVTPDRIRVLEPAGPAADTQVVSS